MRPYPSYFKLQVRWLRDSAHQWASPSGPLQAAFKSAYADLSFTRITYLSKLIGIYSLAALQGS
ncbi:hypothetical protein [Dickeya chrysanthemi]|uniref:hypothetical protein n=1 Tax=Dickeya chrysanthemi TaxID=556 RepID=UPI003018F482